MKCVCVLYCKRTHVIVTTIPYIQRESALERDYFSDVTYLNLKDHIVGLQTRKPYLVADDECFILPVSPVLKSGKIINIHQLKYIL